MIELQTGLSACIGELEDVLLRVRQRNACCPSARIARKPATASASGTASRPVSVRTRAPGSAMAFAARTMRRAQEPCAATWVTRATRNDEPSSDDRRPPQPASAGSVHSKSSTTVGTVSPMTFASCTHAPGPVPIKASRYSSRELTTTPRAEDKRDCPDGGRMVEPAGAGAGMVGFWLARTPCNIASPHARSHGVGPSSEQAPARIASQHGKNCGTVIAWCCHD